MALCNKKFLMVWGENCGQYTHTMFPLACMMVVVVFRLLTGDTELPADQSSQSSFCFITQVFPIIDTIALKSMWYAVFYAYTYDNKKKPYHIKKWMH